MKKYIITDIGRDMDRGVAERLGLGIKTIDTNKKLNVYCEDDMEYIDGDKARKNGDIIEGDLYIRFAEFIEKTNLELMHKWTRLKYSRVNPYMEIVVKVTKVMNDYDICGITDITNEEILIIFEDEFIDLNTHKRYFEEGDTVLLKAELCLDTYGYVEDLKKMYGLD